MTTGEFIPKSTKFNKDRRGRRISKGISKNCNFLIYKGYGIVSASHGVVTNIHIYTFRRVITNFFKRFTKPIIRIFPNTNVTRKQKNVRMGRGKGEVAFWYQRVKPGRVICEFDSLTLDQAKEVTRIVNSKLSIKCKLMDKIASDIIKEKIGK